jgi:hypothetical protein
LATTTSRASAIAIQTDIGALVVERERPEDMGNIIPCCTDQSIAAEPLVKSAPMAAVPPPATKSTAPPAALQKQSVDAIFTICDKNGDGVVTKAELKAAIKANGPDFAQRLGLKKEKESWFGATFFNNADLNQDGRIDRIEFHRIMDGSHKHSLSQLLG